jgi:hypothetical protein
MSIHRVLSGSEPLFRISRCSSRSNKRLTFPLHSAPIEPLKAKSIYVVPGSNPQWPKADPQQRPITTLLLASASIPSMTISPCR